MVENYMYLKYAEFHVLKAGQWLIAFLNTTGIFCDTQFLKNLRAEGAPSIIGMNEGRYSKWGKKHFSMNKKENDYLKNIQNG